MNAKQLLKIEKELLKGWETGMERKFTQEEVLYFKAHAAIQELRIWKEEENERVLRREMVGAPGDRKK